METMDERRIWQRVRGEQEPDRTERLRGMLARQGELRSAYRCLSRRGGRAGLLLEQKEGQIAALRGLLKLATGQGVAPPRGGGGPVDLKRCFAAEQELLSDLQELTRDPQFGGVFEAMLQRQKKQCRLLLELIGTM